MGMFCNQCQEAAKNYGCTVKGVCGKTDDVSNIQRLMVEVNKGISYYIHLNGTRDKNIDKFIIRSMFATITNANFDDDYFVVKIGEGMEILKSLKKDTGKDKIESVGFEPEVASWEPKNGQEILEYSTRYENRPDTHADILSLKELILYGVKGITAYAEHALNLGHTDDKINSFIAKALYTIGNPNIDKDSLIEMVDETGKFGVQTMALLDEANTSSYGHPEISTVNLGVGTNPGILISGHDLKDIEEILQQTDETGVDIYTHSEMLPAHYYPAFKKYKHFIGNYGNSWWNQRKEFESFNGPILFTTNCLVPPLKNATYLDKVYTTGSAGFPGCMHIPDREEGEQKDFTAIIAHAKKCAPPVQIEEGEITGGFARNQLMSLSGDILDAIDKGKIKKFFVMAGCDGRMKSREYYTEFANELPGDTVILTAGCAKYRYNKLPLGDTDGIPRILDAGQCNDSYSLAYIALQLKEILKVNDINELPIEYNIAWYEQKAVIVLLALLHLGVKDIKLGPTLPAFLSPGVADVLTSTYQLKGIKNVKEDLA